MQIVLYLAFLLFVKAVKFQGNTSLGSRVLKFVYGKQLPIDQCRELCERQKSPPCADVEIIGGVCTLRAPLGVHNLPISICSKHEYECPTGFSYKYQENPSKISLNKLPSCYAFGRERLSWKMARTVCKELGGNLVNIETQAENEHLDTVIKQDKKLQTPDVADFGDWAYWAGGFYKGEWIWQTSGASFSYTNWYPGQPDNKGRENCLQIRREQDWRWNNNRCFWSFCGFICETEAKKI